MARGGQGALLLCDKPAGKTSHDLVAAVRRERGGKVGHAGTLDPFATGLLLVLLGRATRLQRFLTALPKTYLATARLGWRSSTGDPDGVLTETGRIPASRARPTGTVRQRVPMTSAVRVGGERLCDGDLVLAYITAADYEASGAGEEMTEGIIDHLRSVEGARVAALIRDLGDRGRAARPREP